MTEIDLQNEIKKILESEIIPQLSLFKQGEMKFYLQDLPLSTEFENEPKDYSTEFEDDGDGTELGDIIESPIDKHLPCCIVAYRGDEIKNANDPQATMIDIIVAVKDTALDMSGYQKLLIVLQRIRDYFLENAGIDGKARLLYPINRNINDNTMPGYFVGHIVTNWQIATMPYNDIHKYL